MSGELFADTFREFLRGLRSSGVLEVRLRPGEPPEGWGPATDFRFVPLDRGSPFRAFSAEHARDLDAMVTAESGRAPGGPAFQDTIDDGGARWRVFRRETAVVPVWRLRVVPPAPRLDDYPLAGPRLSAFVRTLLERDDRRQTTRGFYVAAGRVGCGKSGLLAAVARELTEAGAPVFFVDPLVEFDLAKLRGAIILRRRFLPEDLASLDLIRETGLRDVFISEMNEPAEWRAAADICRMGYRVWTSTHAEDLTDVFERIDSAGALHLLQMIAETRLFPSVADPRQVVPAVGFASLLTGEARVHRGSDGRYVLEPVPSGLREHSVPLEDVIWGLVERSLIDPRYTAGLVPTVGVFSEEAAVRLLPVLLPQSVRGSLPDAIDVTVHVRDGDVVAVDVPVGDDRIGHLIRDEVRQAHRSQPFGEGPNRLRVRFEWMG